MMDFLPLGLWRFATRIREPESCAFSRIRSPFEKRLERATAKHDMKKSVFRSPRGREKDLYENTSVLSMESC